MNTCTVNHSSNDANFDRCAAELRLLLRFRDSEEAMKRARQALATGQTNLAIVHFFRAGERHADYRQVADELAELGVNAAAVLSRHRSTASITRGTFGTLDEISATPMECPKCGETVATVPASSVPKELRRGCPLCGATWFVERF